MGICFDQFLRRIFPQNLMTELHSFHIPVMGLGYTIDTPLKVARYGISSVVSIIEDELVEEMRKHHSQINNRPYSPIERSEIDYRAKRITAYLDLMNELVDEQLNRLKEEPFEEGSELVKYFELLPDNSELRDLYNEMIALDDNDEKLSRQNQLRSKITAGSIDVNIMTKCDRPNYEEDGSPLPQEYSDAQAALRGFANSNLTSSIVFSAGLNPRLYSYCASFKDFYPDASGNFKKKIILKVSDYRSAIVQGRFFAKKGLWVSEYRIESGLNCGGHAFATQGLLMGPILDEFRQNRKTLATELFTSCDKYWKENNLNTLNEIPEVKISVQGGIGTAEENSFLLDYYGVDSTGWGSPFLLVPEATNVDTNTLQQLSTAKKDDYFVSNASPLGVPLNNFRLSTSEDQRQMRIFKGRPGSPCYKKFLAFNTEFGKTPICTASREYQHKKINEILLSEITPMEKDAAISAVMDKECLCEGLGASARITNEIESPHKLDAVAICPGPNLAYFSGSFSLKQMVDHIYGRTNLLNSLPRPHMFVNELKMYIDYLYAEIEKIASKMESRKAEYFEEFKSNLLNGVDYYRNLFAAKKKDAMERLHAMVREDLAKIEAAINSINIPVQV